MVCARCCSVAVGVAAVAAAVVVVQPVDVVRRLALTGALGQLAGGALHDLAARQRAQLGRPLIDVRVPHVVHVVEVALARVGVERDAVVGGALLSGDDRFLFVGVVPLLRLRGLPIVRCKRLVRLGSAAGDADRPQQGAHRDQRDPALCVHRSPSFRFLVLRGGRTLSRPLRAEGIVRKQGRRAPSSKRTIFGIRRHRPNRRMPPNRQNGPADAGPLAEVVRVGRERADPP